MNFLRIRIALVTAAVRPIAGIPSVVLLFDWAMGHEDLRHVSHGLARVLGASRRGDVGR
jgi:hypothetical protein